MPLLTSFVMKMSTSAAPCTKTHTSFSTIFLIRSLRRHSSTSTTRRRIRTASPMPRVRTVSLVFMCLRNSSSINPLRWILPCSLGSLVSSSGTLVSNKATTLTAHSDLSLQSSTPVHQLFKGMLILETCCLTCEVVSMHTLLLTCSAHINLAPAVGAASNAAWWIAACTFTNAWQRYPLRTNHSSTSQLISNRI